MSAIFTTIGKKVSHFLEKLAEANKATLGNERLDCCNLGKPHKPSTEHHPK